MTERLGKNIKTLRLARGLSREALAEKAGISIDTLKRLERGKTKNPSLFAVCALAAALGVSLDALVPLKDNIDDEFRAKRNELYALLDELFSAL